MARFRNRATVGTVGWISKILECPKPNNARLPHRFVHFRGARRARLSQAAAELAHQSSTGSALSACRHNNIAGTRPTTSTSTCARSATFVACKNACKAHDGPRQRDGATTLRMRVRMQSNRTRADSRCAKRSRSSTPSRTSSCSRQNACILLHIKDQLDAALHGLEARSSTTDHRPESNSPPTHRLEAAKCVTCAPTDLYVYVLSTQTS